MFSHGYVIFDVVFSTIFSIAIFYLYFFLIPKRNASLYLKTAATHSQRYGTSPKLDRGDDLKLLKNWKHKELMEDFLRLQHRIYLESELYKHHTAGGLRELADGPDGAQQAIALNIAGELHAINQVIHDKKKKETSRSFLRTLLWGVVGAVFYTVLFAAILFLYPNAGQIDLPESTYLFYFSGLVLSSIGIGFLGGCSWGDKFTLKKLEEETKRLEAKAKPILAYSNLVKAD
jgi:hypothetical protein